MSCFAIFTTLLFIRHFAYHYMSQLLKQIHTQARFTSNLGKFRLNQGQIHMKLDQFSIIMHKNEYRLDRPSCAEHKSLRLTR